MTYASRNWQAVERTDLVGSEHMLVVTGDVEVSQSNQTPNLVKQHPQGASPASLILTLSVDTSGDAGAQVMTWKRVKFAANIASHQYKHVLVTGAAGEQRMDVQQAPS